ELGRHVAFLPIASAHSPPNGKGISAVPQTGALVALPLVLVERETFDADRNVRPRRPFEEPPGVRVGRDERRVREEDLVDEAGRRRSSRRPRGNAGGT